MARRPGQERRTPISRSRFLQSAAASPSHFPEKRTTPRANPTILGSEADRRSVIVQGACRPPRRPAKPRSWCCSIRGHISFRRAATAQSLQPAGSPGTFGQRSNSRGRSTNPTGNSGSASLKGRSISFPRKLAYQVEAVAADVSLQFIALIVSLRGNHP
jgi:hypothetical protein